MCRRASGGLAEPLAPGRRSRVAEHVVRCPASCVAGSLQAKDVVDRAGGVARHLDPEHAQSLTGEGDVAGGPQEDAPAALVVGLLDPAGEGGIGAFPLGLDVCHEFVEGGRVFQVH